THKNALLPIVPCFCVLEGVVIREEAIEDRAAVDAQLKVSPLSDTGKRDSKQHRVKNNAKGGLIHLRQSRIQDEFLARIGGIHHCNQMPGPLTSGRVAGSQFNHSRALFFSYLL